MAEVGHTRPASRRVGRVAGTPEPGREKVLRDLLALEATEGLEGDEARPLRLAQEFLEADLVLSEKEIVSTVVVFGSNLLKSAEDDGSAGRKAESDVSIAD